MRSNVLLDFYADQVFDALYAPALRRVNRALSRSGFGVSADYIKSEYCGRVDENARTCTAAAPAHRDLLARFRERWVSCCSGRVCLVCLARAGERNLSCGHKLCETCVVLHGRPGPDDPGDFTLRFCPLCQASNSNRLRIKPASAGIRGLSVGGTADERGICNILGRLLRDVDLAGSSLPDHFDIVVGTGSGMHSTPEEDGLISVAAPIILGIFCQGWPVDRCMDAAVAKPSRLRPKLTAAWPTWRRPQRSAIHSNAETLLGSSAGGTKVAITATGTKDGLPYLFSNYNGPSRRSKNSDYGLPSSSPGA